VGGPVPVNTALNLRVVYTVVKFLTGLATVGFLRTRLHALRYLVHLFILVLIYAFGGAGMA
jgi:hypothetical protein